MEISEVTQTRALSDLFKVVDMSRIPILTERSRIPKRGSILDALNNILIKDGSNFGGIGLTANKIYEMAYAVVEGMNGIKYHVLSIDQRSHRKIKQTFNVFVFLEDGTNCYLCRVLGGDPQEAREKAYGYTQKFIDGEIKDHLPRRDKDDENLLSVRRPQSRASRYIVKLLQTLNQEGYR